MLVQSNLGPSGCTASIAESVTPTGDADHPSSALQPRSVSPSNCSARLTPTNDPFTNLAWRLTPTSTRCTLCAVSPILPLSISCVAQPKQTPVRGNYSESLLTHLYLHPTGRGWLFFRYASLHSTACAPVADLRHDSTGWPARPAARVRLLVDDLGQVEAGAAAIPRMQGRGQEANDDIQPGVAFRLGRK